MLFSSNSIINDYIELCKPKVVLLMLVTVVVGMYLATPKGVSLLTLTLSLLGIGFCASGAAAINHLVDKRIDAIMLRTKNRPVAHGRVSVYNAIIFASVLCVIGLFILCYFINFLTAFLTFMSVIAYAGVYTGYLKRATSQNIVIGGLAGAAPPLLGWTAVTNQLDPQALLLVLIVFVWTPPHFWALAIYRYEDYKNAKIPMLPVTHGIDYTKLNVFLYSILLFVVTLLPFITGMSGICYLIGAVLLNMRFMYLAWLLFKSNDMKIALKTFHFSIIYLFVLFIFLLVDHYI